ncbi:unnamed protein product, partial [Adineta steineri]
VAKFLGICFISTLIPFDKFSRRRIQNDSFALTSTILSHGQDTSVQSLHS